VRAAFEHQSEDLRHHIASGSFDAGASIPIPQLAGMFGFNTSGGGSSDYLKGFLDSWKSATSDSEKKELRQRLTKTFNERVYSAFISKYSFEGDRKIPKRINICRVVKANASREIELVSSTVTLFPASRYRTTSRTIADGTISETIAGELSRRLDDVEKKVAAIDQNVAGLGSRLDVVQPKVESDIPKRLDDIEKKVGTIDGLGSRLDVVQARVESVIPEQGKLRLGPIVIMAHTSGEGLTIVSGQIPNQSIYIGDDKDGTIPSHQGLRLVKIVNGNWVGRFPQDP